MTELPSLFDGLEVPTGEKPRPKYVRPVAYGACPECAATRVGLVLTGRSQHLMWKVHHRYIGGRSGSTCPVSGQLLCSFPARQVPSLADEVPICPHAR